jgi:hypothetical protein
MKFLKFEDLWTYSEKISSCDLISVEDSESKIIECLKNKDYGEVLYYLSNVTREKDINIFIELQRAVEDHFLAQQEDD